MNVKTYLLPIVLLFIIVLSLSSLLISLTEDVRRAIMLETLIDKLKTNTCKESEVVLYSNLLKLVIEEDEKVLVIIPLLFTLNYYMEECPVLGIVAYFMPLSYASSGIIGLKWLCIAQLELYTDKEYNDPIMVGVDEEGWRKFSYNCRKFGEFVRRHGSVKALIEANNELFRISCEIEKDYNLKRIFLHMPIFYEPRISVDFTPYYVNLGPTERDRTLYYGDGYFRKLSPSEISWISRHFILVDPIVIYNNRHLVIRAIIHLSVTYFRVNDLWRCKLFIRVYGLGEGVKVYLQNSALTIRIKSSPTNLLK